MELGSSILGFLENKSILVTGATGFLAKVFMEKILRVQPNVRKLYLLVRAQNQISAKQRFDTEIISKDLFRVLKEKYGSNLHSLLSDKVTLIPGDIAYGDLGILDSKTLEILFKEIDVVINLAATTNFDERYDVSLKINTFGAMHVLDFCKKCDKLKVFLHVSTAYVSGETEGLIKERPYRMGETLNGSTDLDVYSEKKLMEDTLKQLGGDGFSDEHIKSTMQDFGIERARKFGWPNTYVFTKAMGEMLLGETKGSVPLVIIRPTIVTSTYKEPFSGWIEGMRTIDSIVVGYGKGRITSFLADPKTIIDLIPADMVVNGMIVAMVGHANEPIKSSIIYHIGSSVSNPLQAANMQHYIQTYFMETPWINKQGNPVLVRQVKLFHTIQSFHRFMAFRYLFPLQVLKVLNTVSCQYFTSYYLELRRKIKFVMRLIDLYTPYLFFKGSYDGLNTEKLRKTMKSGDESDLFYFDPKKIDWQDYFINAHIPGLVKYVFK